MKLEYDFCLVADGLVDLTVEMMNALHEAGCDDATVSVRHRQIWLSFTRTAESREEAVKSAIEDAAKAGIRANYSKYARTT